MRGRLISAGRGVLTGTAVVAASYLSTQIAIAYAQADSNNYTNGADALGEAVVVLLSVGLPFCYLTGVLFAWSTRMLRPWLYSLCALAPSTALVCGVRAVGVGATMAGALAVYAAVAFWWPGRRS